MGRVSTAYAAPLLVVLLAVSPLTLAISERGVTAQASTVGLGAEDLEKALELASPQTRTCVACHRTVTPGIVYEWLRSRHAWSKPDNVIPMIYERIGAKDVTIAEKFRGYPYSVGCYECHGMFADAKRPDVVNHFGIDMVTISDRQGL